MKDKLLDAVAVGGGATLCLIIALFFLSYALERREWKKGRLPHWFLMGANDPHEGCLLLIAVLFICYFALLGERLFWLFRAALR